jgi:hypothetical protein
VLGHRNNRVVRRLVLAVAGMAAVGALYGPASASAALSDCNGRQFAVWFCAWQDAGYSGTMWSWAPGPSVPERSWFYVGDAANDKASSVDNFRVYRTYIGENVNWKTEGGGHACMTAGQVYRNWGDGGGPNGGTWFWPQSGKVNDTLSGLYLDNATGGGKCSGEPTLSEIIPATKAPGTSTTTSTSSAATP